MKALIVNIVTLNAGDAAMLEGEMRALRRAFGEDTRVLVLDQDAAAASRLYPGYDIRPSLATASSLGRRLRGRPRLARVWLARIRLAAWLLGRGIDASALLLGPQERELLAEHRSADLVISSGGTILVERYDLTPRLLELDVARLLGRPLILYTQSLEPFRRPSVRRRMARTLAGARLVLVRGERSRDALADLGVPEDSVMIGADAAFELVDEQAVRARAGVRPGRPLRVAVSVRDVATLHGSAPIDAYSRGMAAICQTVVERHDADVVMISSCQGVPEYWTDDSAVAQRVIDMLPTGVRRRVTLDRSHRPPLALRDELQRFDAVIATRLHVAILALCVGTPALVVAYEDKADEVILRLGPPHQLLPIGDVVAGTSGEAVDRFLRSVVDGSALPAEAVMSEYREARRSADLVHAVASGRVR